MSDGDNTQAAFQLRVAEAREALEAGNEAVLDYLVPGWREVALSSEDETRPTGDRA